MHEPEEPVPTNVDALLYIETAWPAPTPRHVLCDCGCLHRVTLMLAQFDAAGDAWLEHPPPGINQLTAVPGRGLRHRVAAPGAVTT